MKIDNYADVMVFPGYQVHHGQAFLDVSAAYVCEIDNSVVPVDDAWQWLMPLFPDEPFDIGLKHWRGCFAVAGSAYPPADQSPTKHLTVSASVGSLSKSLWVHGDRTWQKTAGVWQYSDVKPFASMPLDLPHALGHKTWQENPHGIGYYANPEEALGQPVANIEHVNQPMFKPNEAPPELPTFLPLPSGTPTQNQWLGKIDAKWQKERFPWLPDDTDQRWYDRVPQDQCLPKETYWRGDEYWQVTHMHPEHAELKGRLPGLRPRVFYRMKGNLELISELPVTLDTVWLFPNEQRVAVIYRGQLPVKFEDASDVERIGIFSEKLDAPALSLPQYQQQWLEKIGTEVSALARPLNAKGLLLPKAVAAGATATALAAATGAAAKPKEDASMAAKAKEDAVAKADDPKAADKAKPGDKPPQAEVPKHDKDPEIAALDKAFDEGPEAFSKAMDQHFRNKFQTALDEAKAEIDKHGLDDLLKDHPLPTVDEIMAKTPTKDPAIEALDKAFDQGPDQFSNAMDQHFRNKFQTALDEAKAEIDKHGLDDLLKDHPLPTVNEIMAKTPANDPAIAALDKAFDQGAEQFSQVMDQHFRTKFQSALDEAAKQIAEHGLEDLLKDHPLPSVDEIMKKK